MKFFLISMVCLVGAVVAQPGTKQKRDVLPGDPRYGYHDEQPHPSNILYDAPAPGPSNVYLQPLPAQQPPTRIYVPAPAPRPVPVPAPAPAPVPAPPSIYPVPSPTQPINKYLVPVIQQVKQNHVHGLVDSYGSPISQNEIPAIDFRVGPGSFGSLGVAPGVSSGAGSHSLGHGGGSGAGSFGHGGGSGAGSFGHGGASGAGSFGHGGGSGAGSFVVGGGSGAGSFGAGNGGGGTLSGSNGGYVY